jgi:uncharacterized protein GlcG (DUF336 family)
VNVVNVQNLTKLLAVGVAGVFVVGAGFALVQELIKDATLQTVVETDISLEQALQVAQGAVDECKKSNSPVTVAVVDRVGDIRFAVRGNGGTADDIDVARRKAYTARTFRQATSDWIKHTAPDAVDAKGKPILLTGQRLLENTITRAGGMPIIYHGDAIGGVGVVGSKGGDEMDEVCAKAGQQAIADQLL